MTPHEHDPAGEPNVLIVGGYGEVGRFVAAELARGAVGRPFVAGRDRSRAEDMAAQLGTIVRGRRIDLSDAATFAEALQDIGVVVVCVEQGDTGFVEACLRRGIHYVDVSASDTFLRRVEALEPVAVAHGGTAVLSVGLAPGVTNLLAQEVVEALDDAERIDIHLLLGLGDEHGPAAIDWMLERSHAAYTIGEGRDARTRLPFTEPRRVELPPFGSRTTYRFDFADQHVIARTLGVPVETRICFDSAWVTSVFAGLGAMGILRCLRWRGARKSLRSLLQRARFGSDQFVARADATGTHRGEHVYASAIVHGHREARTTGIVAAYVVECLLHENLPAGIRHMHQLGFGRGALARLDALGHVVTPARLHPSTA